MVYFKNVFKEDKKEIDFFLNIYKLIPSNAIFKLLTRLNN
jgi:hypothetical protein